MTLEETSKILTLITQLYPNFTMSSAKGTAIVWQKVLEDDDPLSVQNALLEYAKTDESGFAPAPGALHRTVSDKTNTADESLNEVVAQFHQAATRGILYSQEEFAKFTPIAQKAIGSHATIKKWAVMDEKSLQIDLVQTAKVYLQLCERAKMDKAANRISEGKYKELMSAPSTPMLEEKPVQKPVEPKPAASQDEEERTLYIREDGTRITKAPKGFVEEYQRRVREQNAERRNS